MFKFPENSGLSKKVMSQLKSRRHASNHEDLLQLFVTRSFQYNQGTLPSNMIASGQLTAIEELLSINLTNNQETSQNDVDKKYVYPSIIPQFCEEIGDFKSFDADTQNWLQEITNSIFSSIDKREFGNSYKQFYYYNQKLSSYITIYGYRMPKELLVKLIKSPSDQ